MPGPGVEPPTSGMPSSRANHYTTAPLWDVRLVLVEVSGVADGVDDIGGTASVGPSPIQSGTGTNTAFMGCTEGGGGRLVLLGRIDGLLYLMHRLCNVHH